MNDASTRASAEFWPVMIAGYKLWPFVSLLGFAAVRSVKGRTLLGSVAGLGWNIYLSLMAGK